MMSLAQLKGSFIVHLLKKAVVMIPAFLIMAAITADYLSGYKHTHNVFLNMLPLLVFIFWSALRKVQNNIIDIIIQTTFFVYIYGVLYEAVVLIPLDEIISAIAGGGWTGSPVGINLAPFRKFADYELLHRQVTGNLIMLFPLGFYLPLLYKKVNSLSRVLLVSFLVSLSIESIQLIFTFAAPGGFYYRAFDIDDIILNTTGACLGYYAYMTLNLIFSNAKRYLAGNSEDRGVR